MSFVSDNLEKERLSHALETAESHKKKFGQYLTPYAIAKYMASLFPKTNDSINILDPGAGIGTLSCAFLDRIIKEKWNNPEINLTAYDIDKTVIDSLSKNLEEEGIKLKNFNQNIYTDDFLQKTSFEYSYGRNEQFRLFSGHTQVNATDLRNLPYPTISQLLEMGKKLETCIIWNQEVFDSIAMEFINEKIKELFSSVNAELVYISAFPDKSTFVHFAHDIAWETEAWIADNPSHMIHFNGDKFLGPHK